MWIPAFFLLEGHSGSVVHFLSCQLEKKDHLLAQHSQERSSARANINKLSLHPFSPVPNHARTAYSCSVMKCCPSRALLTRHVSKALQFEKISAIPSERDDPPTQFTSGKGHFVSTCIGTAPRTDKAMDHRGFSATYLTVSSRALGLGALQPSSSVTGTSAVAAVSKWHLLRRGLVHFLFF